MMKRKDTRLTKTAPVAAICTLLVLLPMASFAQMTGNPWNPFPRQPAQMVQVPRYNPQTNAQQPQQTPSRFAPPGLEQQLAAGPLRQAARPAPVARQTWPDNGQQAIGQTYFPPQAGGYPGGAGYAPNYGPGQGYGGYPQAFGGPPGRYGYNGYNSYGGYGGYGRNGGNGPFSPFGFPGGSGGMAPFPGTFTNGGIPGFGMSPFGFF